MNDEIIRKGQILFNFLLKTTLKDKKVSELTMKDMQEIVQAIEGKEGICH